MNNNEDRSAASVKAVEIAVAAIISLFGGVVMFDSYRVGASWGDEGPQAGYFPFFIGLLIIVSAVVTLVRASLDAAPGLKSFVSRNQLKLILTVLVPTIVYVALIVWLGLYLASTLYIALFMWRLGRYAWVKILPVAIGVSLAFFLTFEVWFKVPLPKGPLEAALGLN
ncbi:MAG: hypothetical protein A3I00_01175 [Betaproteobacteria bacterium RIFCSPLOWO2_02_FULL_64_12]|nr:MAG: hypothetical protein A3I00_01175 [Betaproteobacteria bacterium RIFCSPLOWO2_02_FULL_64_12]